MLTDPQAVTILGTTSSLPRVSVSGSQATYATSDETVVLAINHATTKSKRKRHEVRFTWAKVVTDPVSNANDSESTTITFVIDRPPYGFTETDVDGMATAFRNWLAVSGLVGKLYGNQS